MHALHAPEQAEASLRGAGIRHMKKFAMTEGQGKKYEKHDKGLRAKEECCPDVSLSCHLQGAGLSVQKGAL